MKFKEGDKVLFLNEKGGGVVTRIVDEQIVNVAIDDGFEIPYAVNDLIKAEGEEADAPAPAKKAESGIAEKRKTDSLEKLPHQAEAIEQGIYLAMIPRNQEQVLSSAMDFYLVNHSSYQALFSLYQNKSGNYHGLLSGTINASSKYHLGKVERTEIDIWGHALLQAVFFKEGKAEVVPPLSDHIVFKAVKIYKEDCFVFNSLLHQKAITVKVATISELHSKANQRFDVPDSVRYWKEQEEQVQDDSGQKKRKEGFLDRYMVGDNMAEVDLHIAELTDKTMNMTNADMLQLQLDHVKQCLEAARKERIKKLVFIHGVGNGTLKTELQRLLEKRNDVEYYDAAFARYGMGATEVSVYHTKAIS